MLNKMQPEQQVPNHFQKPSNLRSIVMDRKHLGRFSVDGHKKKHKTHKTTTQVITVAYHNGHKHTRSLIKTQSRYM